MSRSSSETVEPDIASAISSDVEILGASESADPDTKAVPKLCLRAESDRSHLWRLRSIGNTFESVLVGSRASRNTKRMFLLRVCSGRNTSWIGHPDDEALRSEATRAPLGSSALAYEHYFMRK